jgi:hypothetical protein
MQIILQNVLASLDGSMLNSLARDIPKEFKNTKVTVGSSLAQLDVWNSVLRKPCALGIGSSAIICKIFLSKFSTLPKPEYSYNLKLHR